MIVNILVKIFNFFNLYKKIKIKFFLEMLVEKYLT